ncbi:MAG: hypothetical protein NTV52_19330 [Acidobacteria bacterium]|nr:hypothetical protein [Acidobacteriota bacterium]
MAGEPIGILLNPTGRYEAACRRTSHPEVALDSLRQRAIDWWQANPEADLSQALDGVAENAARRRLEVESAYSGY